MKKGAVILKGIILAIVIMLVLISVRWLFFNVIKRNSIIDGLVNFRETVINDMEAGKEDGIYYVKNVNKKDVNMINLYIDSAIANVDTYRIILESGDYLAIQLNYIKSDNYYVLRKYLYGEEIPADNTRANEIYNVIESFIDRNITLGMSDYDKEIAVHDYIVKNCMYGFPEVRDDVYTAYGVLVTKMGVCDGYAEAFYLFMSCLGIECDIVVGDTCEGLHAWNQIKLDDNWYHVDLTWDDSLPDMGEYVKHSYVNLTDEVLDKTHSWEHQFYNRCSSDSYNYYKKSYYFYEDYDDFKKGIARQYGRSNVLEAAVIDIQEQPDLSFLFGSGGIRKVNYIVEDMKEYKVVIIYVNK